MKPTRVCSVPSCANRHDAKGLCKGHYSYLRRTGQPFKPCGGCGDPLRTARLNYCSDDCKPRCSVAGCGGHQRKRGWCASHYSQWQSTGKVRPFKYKWADTPGCVVCGAEAGTGFRRYCSSRCAALGQRDRPTHFDCNRCGETVSLIVESTKTGQFKRADSKLCDRCSRRSRRYVITVDHLAARDGTDCGICGKPVNMKAGSKDLDRPSVDHIHPRSRGGDDSAENLQLTHLRCNQRKGDKIL